MNENHSLHHDFLPASRCRLPSKDFQCTEVDNFLCENQKDAPSRRKYHKQGGVRFCCSLANRHSKDSAHQTPQPQRLIFDCREPSYGVLTLTEKALPHNQSDDMPNVIDHYTPHEPIDDIHDKINDDDDDDDNGDDVFDPSFIFLYDKDYPYALVGRTGFQVWPGTRILVDALTYPRPSDPPRLQQWQAKLFHPNNKRPLRILELGAGVGVVGTILAAAGAHVVMTDLPLVVKQSLQPNLQRNLKLLSAPNMEHNTESVDKPPVWMSSILPPKNSSATDSDLGVIQKIGQGWATTASLDWTQPLEQQLSRDTCQHLDLVIAGDCVWLPSMLQGLFATVSTMFQLGTGNTSTTTSSGNEQEHSTRQPSSPTPRLLVSFQEREADMFTSMERFQEELDRYGWTMECLAWYPVVFANDNNDNATTNDHNVSSEGNTNIAESSSSNATKAVCLLELAPPPFP